MEPRSGQREATRFGGNFYHFSRTYLAQERARRFNDRLSEPSMFLCLLRRQLHPLRRDPHQFYIQHKRFKLSAIAFTPHFSADQPLLIVLIMSHSDKHISNDKVPDKSENLSHLISITYDFIASKSLASWRSRNCSCGSPHARFTIRPR